MGVLSGGVGVEPGCFGLLLMGMPREWERRVMCLVGVEGDKGWCGLGNTKVGERVGEIGVRVVMSVGRGRPHFPHARLRLMEKAGEA